MFPTIVKKLLQSPLYLIFSLFWFVVLTKKLFFWVWLWQLKEYHFKRFLAHFDTYKGKKLILNSLNLLKLVCFFALLFLSSSNLPLILLTPIVVIFVFLIFGLEALLTFYRILKRNFRYPVFTKKTIVILTTGLFLEIVFLYFGLVFNLSGFLGLLVIDVLAPVIFSILVLCFWPITHFWQKRLIQRAVKKRKEFENLLVIGITGSYGKTSTKEFLYTILASKYGQNKVLKTKAHQNSEAGISRCILNDLRPEHEIFIVEMGAYNRGGIKLLCDIAEPKIGILTGINEQHLSTFGSQENIVKAKFELLDSLPENGIAVLNGDNAHISKLKTQNSPKENLRFPTGQAKLQLKTQIYYSIREKFDVWARNIKNEKESFSFDVFSKDGGWANFRVNLVGEHNVLNILGAVTVAKELGMNLKEISGACEKIKPFEKTMELKKGVGGVTIVDDTYSANPIGVEAALDYLKLYSGQKIIIMPCLIELGQAAKRVHKRIGEKIGKICDLGIITTKDYFKEIRNGAIKSGMKEGNILYLENPQEIFEKIKFYCLPSEDSTNMGKPENVILLESRVPGSLMNFLIK